MQKRRSTRRKREYDEASLRLAALAVDAYLHRSTTTIKEFLLDMGATDLLEQDGSFSLKGPSGVRVGFPDDAGDPVTYAVQLGFAVAGQYWPWVLPDLLGATNELWRSVSKGHPA